MYFSLLKYNKKWNNFCFPWVAFVNSLSMLFHFNFLIVNIVRICIFLQQKEHFITKVSY